SGGGSRSDPVERGRTGPKLTGPRLSQVGSHRRAIDRPRRPIDSGASRPSRQRSRTTTTCAEATRSSGNIDGHEVGHALVLCKVGCIEAQVILPGSQRRRAQVDRTVQREALAVDKLQVLRRHVEDSEQGSDDIALLQGKALSTGKAVDDPGPGIVHGKI